MADSPLLNYYEPDIELNNPTRQPADTSILIAIYSLDPLDPPAHDKTTLVFIKYY